MRKRRFTCLALILALTMTFAMPASAVSSFSYAIENVTYSWLQSTQNPWVSEPLYVDDSDAQIAFEGVANSAQHGRFTVRLEKYTGNNNWEQVNNAYYVYQHHESTYNLRTNQYVLGQYFKCFWATTNGSGTFRVSLSECTAPQVTGLLDVYFYVKHS